MDRLLQRSFHIHAHADIPLQHNACALCVWYQNTQGTDEKQCIGGYLPGTDDLAGFSAASSGRDSAEPEPPVLDSES